MKKKLIKEESYCSRREYIKIGGAVAAGLQVRAVAGAGLAAGKDPSTHTGWQHLGVNTQFVDRTKLIRKGPAYKIVGETLRPERQESAFGRQGLIMRDTRQYREMLRSFDAGEERQQGMGNQQPAPQAEMAPEVTGGMKPYREEIKFPPVEAFNEPMLSYYRARPDLYELDKWALPNLILEIVPS